MRGATFASSSLPAPAPCATVQRVSLDPTSELAREAQRGGGGLVKELIGMMRQNKKWWLLPILIVLVLAAVLVTLGGGSIAPFIYAVF